MRSRQAASALVDLLLEELLSPVLPQITAAAQALAYRKPVLGVLFYGSQLRKYDPEGVADFYVIVRKQEDWNKLGPSYWLNYIFPPNVEYFETVVDGERIKTKVAVITLHQFRRRMQRLRKDTTLWARFCQPCRLVLVKDSQAMEDLLSCLVRAVSVAVWWCTVLGPLSGTARDYWVNLLTLTYDMELRVEKKERIQEVVSDIGEERFAGVLRLVLQAISVPFREEKGIFSILLSNKCRDEATKKWKKMKRTGKLINLAWLFKGALTFQGGSDYLLWKIQRHTGINLHLSPLQKKYPILFAPFLVCKWNKIRKNYDRGRARSSLNG